MKGTITWFEADQQLPRHEGAGVWVLGFFGKNSPIESVYYWDDGGFQRLKPTHWAYINLPE